MPSRRTPIPAEAWERAFALYRDTDVVAGEIIAELGVDPTWFYHRLRRARIVLRRDRPVHPVGAVAADSPPIADELGGAVRTAAPPPPADAGPVDIQALAARMARLVAHNMTALEGSLAAVRDVMVEGPSGVLAIHDRGERPVWSPALRRLTWPNGVVAHTFSSEDPDGLRGPQFDAAWGDELAKWRHPQETWDMLQFGLRLGASPREVMTTTPRPLPLLRRLLTDPRVAISRSRTSDNAAHLAPAFLRAVVGHYDGTRLGRQELDGEMIAERADALWTRDAI